jgi:hypothetical protein
VAKKTNIPNLPPEFLAAGGVHMNPPPQEFIKETRSIISDAVKSIKVDRQGALLWVATANTDGEVNLNLAYAHKIRDNITVTAWIGKEWGQPIAAGVAGTWDF